MLLKVYSENPSPRHLKIILDALKAGKVIIYPTDTVYAICCDMKNRTAIDNLCKVIGKSTDDANLSIICSNLSNISEYTVPFETRIYKLMKKLLPGPYTFILNANPNVPKIFKKNKKTIGIRVPDNNLAREMVEEYGSPIVTASIKDHHHPDDYPTDPKKIHEIYGNLVEIVIDGGPGGNIPSTVLDCTGDEVTIVRQGKGEVFL